ncbi:hypothetical protein AAC387_Pa01g2476 [Persea americana]
MEEASKIKMPRVKLGSQGLEVSRLGFGCGGLSGIYNSPLPHEDGISVIKHAFDRGVTFFDTSDIYGPNNDNEFIVGKALKQLPRENIQLATKFGIVKIDEAKMHRVDISVPIEDTMGELKKLVEEGKIKYIGLSEASPDTIRRAHTVHPITAVQIEWSLWTRDIEKEIIPLCRELGIGIVSYSPLGRGFFAGKAVVESLPAESLLVYHPRFSGDNLEKNKLLYLRVASLAAKHGCTPPQLALAWVLHQGEDVVPLPGTTKIRNLDDNIGTLMVKLSEEDLQELSDAVPSDMVSGTRDYDLISQVTWKNADTPAKNVQA